MRAFKMAGHRKILSKQKIKKPVIAINGTELFTPKGIHPDLECNQFEGMAQWSI